ncbi:MAG TPA: hypothetical protein VII87_11490 [Solirubrobacteraceae bacterium]
MIETVRLAHHRTRTRRVSVHAIRGSVKAGLRVTLTVTLPKAALTALGAGTREALALALTATNSNGTGHGTLTIGRLRGTRSP